MKLLGSTESKITKDKNGENAPHLKITEVVSVQWLSTTEVVSVQCLSTRFKSVAHVCSK